MRLILIILFWAPVICFSQHDKTNSAGTKPSTTDCPTWNNKSKSASKADYFKYLRSGKPMPQNQVNTTNNSNAKVQSKAVSQRTKSEPVIKRNDEPTNQHREENPVVVSKKEKAEVTKSARTENTVSPFDEKEKTASTTKSSKSKKNTAKPEEIATASDIVVKEKPVKESAKKDVPEKAIASKENASDKKVMDGASQKSSKQEEGSKLDEEKDKLKKKMALHTRRTTKVRKHSNSKCPSF